jgi:hypothetical protein
MAGPKITTAEEHNDGFITATVAFEDGLNQTVRLPKWANKKNIKDEAVRMREESEARIAAKTSRSDLVE